MKVNGVYIETLELSYLEVGRIILRRSKNGTGNDVRCQLNMRESKWLQEASSEETNEAAIADVVDFARRMQ